MKPNPRLLGPFKHNDFRHFSEITIPLLPFVPTHLSTKSRHLKTNKNLVIKSCAIGGLDLEFTFVAVYKI